MAKINTLTVEGTKKDGFKVTAMLDDGAIVEIKEGFEFKTIEDFDGLKTSYDGMVAERGQHNDLKTENKRLTSAANVEMDRLHADYKGQLGSLQAEIGWLQQQLAHRPEVVRAPLMHVEHQDIPTGRTVDKLAPLDALAPAPALPEPDQYRLELDPDAPARPPLPGELARVHSPIEQVGDVDGRTQEAHTLLNDIERRRLDQISREPTRVNVPADDPAFQRRGIYRGATTYDPLDGTAKPVDDGKNGPENNKLTNDDI